MDFDLNDEQRLIKDSIDRLISDQYQASARADFMKSPRGFSESIWRQFAELGLLGLTVPEEFGGSGGGPVETMLIMEAIGRGLTLEPYVSSAVMAAAAIRIGGSAKAKADLLPGIAEGKMVIALALAEAQSRFDHFDVMTAAAADGTNFRLTGKKTLVMHGGQADYLIVSARSSGARRDQNGISLFLVDAAATGVSRREYPTLDGMRAAEITLDNVLVSADRVLGAPGNGILLIDAIVDIGIAALSAEAVGALEAVHQMTVDYLKTRKQFGVAIGSFQVLQHRSVDMFVALDQARSMAMLAAMMAEDPDIKERRKAISAAKVQIGNSIRLITQESVQMHGGIGMTMEYALGSYVRRLTIIEKSFGDTGHHLAALAAMV